MILITGFEPFDNALTNPSFEAVKLLPDKIMGADIEKLELPVVFGNAAEMIIDKIKKQPPAAVIMTGVASDRDRITPEVTAINLANARIPDNAGNKPKWARITEDAPDGLFSTLPVNRMVTDMKEAGLSAALSFSAGTYVCNDTFFRVCNYVRSHAPAIPCGFIHVPDPQGAGKASGMTLEDFARALEICVKTVLRTKE